MTDLHFEPCALCGGVSFKKIFDAQRPLRSAGHVHGGAVPRCRGCGLVMLNPRPARESLLQLFSGDFEPHRLDAGDADRMVDAQHARRRLVEKVTVHGGLKAFYPSFVR